MSEEPKKEWATCPKCDYYYKQSVLEQCPMCRHDWRKAVGYSQPPYEAPGLE
jgi:ssDNA-binding Zn-finger/Zn-ribbon topoisomerase 1